MSRFVYSARPTERTRPRTLEVLLETVSTIATDKGHDVSAYLEALRRVRVFASNYLVCGLDSVVFDRGDEVVKVTGREFRDDYGTRPFDIPIIERMKISVREGKTVTVFVQPRAAMDCNERDAMFFRAAINEIGYKFIDYGTTQIGRYRGEVVLVDPFAVRKYGWERKYNWES